MRLIHPLFQRGLTALLALFEKEGGSIAKRLRRVIYATKMILKNNQNSPLIIS